MSFVSVDTAVDLVNKGWYMAKVDLRSAYRHAPISLKSREAAGLKWRFSGDSHYTHLIDTRLMFGARLSVNAFHRLTQSVVRMLKRRGINAVICYLDDFFVTAATKQECELVMNALVKLLSQLGFTISWNKCVTPCTSPIFLGINIDTIRETTSIPSEKLKDVKTTLDEWGFVKNRASKRELQQLIGRLNWIAYVIHAVRPTLRHLIDRMVALRAPHHRTRISASLQTTIRAITQICISFNGSSLFLRKATPEAAFVVTDSSTTGGGAALLHQSRAIDWIYSCWKQDNPHLTNAHINVKELGMVLMAVKRWAPIFRNCKLNVYTDNTTTLHAVNKGSTRNRIGASMLLELLVLCAQFNIKLCAIWISTRNNKLADSISRMHELPYATFAGHRITMNNLLLNMSVPSYTFLLQEWYSKKRYWIVK